MADQERTVSTPSGAKSEAVDVVGTAQYPIVKIGIGSDGAQPVHLGPANPLPACDPFLEIARGNVTGHSHVNKFGLTTNADDGVDTDLWDNSGTTVIWVAPTQARTHQIVSSSTSDDGSPVGVGARTIRVYGLKTWSTAETSEVITMNGTTNVATANTYVIIHRMEVLTKGATNVNVGVITATADTDGTITAQINAGHGQTEMAVYGIPDTQAAYCTTYYGSMIKNQQATTAELHLLFNPEPDAELLNFLFKQDVGLDSVGSSHFMHIFKPYLKLAGPGIVKLQGDADKDNTTISGGFDLILVDN